MVRRLGLGKNNHLTYASLALNPQFVHQRPDQPVCTGSLIRVLAVGTRQYLDHAKQKDVLEHSQNAHVQTHPMHVQNLIWAFALH